MWNPFETSFEGNKARNPPSRQALDANARHKAVMGIVPNTMGKIQPTIPMTKVSIWSSTGAGRSCRETIDSG